MRSFSDVSRALAADARGASIIELAIAVPFLLVMTLGMVDAAMGYAAKLQIQQAAARTIEMATASGINSPAFTTQNLQADAVAASGQNSSNVKIDIWMECDGVLQPVTAVSCASGQQIAHFVAVTINGTYAPIMSGPMQIFHLPTSFPIQGRASVRMQ
ncbi:MAG TPA: TadE/TadG family type IV pilus assembly protein [Sphingomonas sp.]|nr:TadE/TadG family type IV pilus assembly protein [Sphingomonas sp.]